MTNDVDNEIRACFLGRTPDPQNEYRALERVSGEIEAMFVTRGQERSRPNRRRRVATVVAIAAMSVLSASAVVGATDIPSPFHHEIASKVPALHNAQLPGLTDAEVSILKQGLGQHERRLDVDTGPALSEIKLEGGVALLDEPGVGRVAAVEGTRGDLCFVSSYEGRVMGVDCASELRPSGIAYSNTSGARGEFLVGVAAEGVSSITVRDRSGEVTPASIHNGAFAWRGEAGSTPAAVTIVRDGVSTTYSMASL
jgi:hypothetical protein